MQLTIIRDDNVVIVDGRALSVDLSGLPGNLHAVQWDGASGHIEYNDGALNEPLTGISAFADVVAAWTAACDAADAPPPEPTPAQRRAALLSAISARKNDFRDGGFVLGGVRWDSDPAARLAYAELAQRLAADSAFVTRWKASEGQWVDMSAALFQTVYTAGAAHISTAFAWQEAEEARLAATDDGALAVFVVSLPQAVAE